MENDKPKLEKYGGLWPANLDPLRIEIACIRKGGRWKTEEGKEVGAGLFQHYLNFQKLVWPEKKWHKWNHLLLEQFCYKSYIGIMGPASSSKTREASDYGLSKYFCFPEETSVIITSTESRGMDLRIWGEMKRNWMAAKSRYPWLSGHGIGSKQMITTDGKWVEARDLRKGLIGVPSVVGGQFVGLSKFVGLKNKHVLLIADELQFLTAAFIDSISNLSSNDGFQAIGMGNPKDPTDALGRFCEPAESVGGWDGLDDSEKTKTWPTRFTNGVCVQLVGTDSPNFDVPEDAPVPFPFLIGRKKIANDLALYGRDSLQFSMMNLGMMPKGSSSRRIITKQLCILFGATEEPVWRDGKITRIFGLDAAYSSVGGDRCMVTELHMGNDINGKQILSVAETFVVPIKGNVDVIPEDQIAKYVMAQAVTRGVSPENVFYDSTGRGTLGTSFARLWSNMVNPVEFGGTPSERPVSADIKATCKEYYSKFVTELWYSVRLIIESGQMRRMTDSLINEGSMREWTIVRGNKTEVEDKTSMKKRVGRSPDEFDSLVVACEGARRKGFVIQKLGDGVYEKESMDWLNDLRNKNKELNKRNTLAKVA